LVVLLSEVGYWDVVGVAMMVRSWFSCFDADRAAVGDASCPILGRRKS
jgi:hypothetical protein